MAELRFEERSDRRCENLTVSRLPGDLARGGRVKMNCLIQISFETAENEEGAEWRREGL